MNRRQVLAVTPSLTALAAQRIGGASTRLRLGLIGSGGRGRHVASTVLAAGNVELAAACDVYEPNAEAARTMNPSVQICSDHRRVLDRSDIDAVVIATPDHWHVPVLLDALRAGKHVYVEKPVTHESDDDAAIAAEAGRSGRVVQVGVQQRSAPHFVEAGKLIREGALGRLLVVRMHWYQNLYDFKPEAWPIDTLRLDWARWQGRAAAAEFSVIRFKRWRFFRAYSGGLLTDLLSHWIDLVQWYTNVRTPETFQAMGQRRFMTGTDLPDTVQASFDFPGFQVVFNTSMGFGMCGGGLMLHGTKASMNLRRDGFEVYSEAELPRGSNQLPKPSAQMPGGRDATYAHAAAFVASIRDGVAPTASIEAGLAAARVGHWANQSLREGRTLRFSGEQRSRV